MSTDVYLEAHSAREDFSLDGGDVSVAWRKNWVPLSWLMFFCQDDLTAPFHDEAPHLTADRTHAIARFRDRLETYRVALTAFAGDLTGFEMLVGYVEERGLPWLSIRTWEVWICEIDTYPEAFLRAVAAVDAGPASPDWDWMLDWCHPASDNRLTGYALFGGANRIHPHRPWLEA